MKDIANEELEKKDLILEDEELVSNKKDEKKITFHTGDIVIYKNDTEKAGIVLLVEDDELTIKLSDNTETVEDASDLVVMPPIMGLDWLKDSNLLGLWEELSNGKSEDFDLKCIYINDKVINEVPFIKAFKNTTTLLDKKFKRGFILHRKFKNKQIYKTNLYSIVNEKVGLDTSRYVYYLLEDNVVYYLGIDLNDKELLTYLYNR